MHTLLEYHEIGEGKAADICCRRPAVDCLKIKKIFQLDNADAIRDG